MGQLPTWRRGGPTPVSLGSLQAGRLPLRADALGESLQIQAGGRLRPTPGRGWRPLVVLRAVQLRGASGPPCTVASRAESEPGSWQPQVPGTTVKQAAMNYCKNDNAEVSCVWDQRDGELIASDSYLVER